MTKDPHPSQSARTKRLASALRDNLKKRKAQSRGRAPDKPPQENPETPPETKS